MDVLKTRLNKEGSQSLKKYKRLKLEAADGKKYRWYIPGGRLQQGESQMDALLREVNEEIGFQNRFDMNL